MKGLTAIFYVCLIIFIGAVMSTFFGALGGWIVGLFFTDTILGTLQVLGFTTTGLTMWKLGATLGFVGGFLRPIVNNKKE